jgi:hypothetical protein
LPKTLGELESEKGNDWAINKIALFYGLIESDRYNIYSENQTLDLIKGHLGLPRG